MGRRINKWIVDAVRPPLVIISFASRPIYRLLFSRADRRQAMKNQERLAGDIQDCVPFVFHELGGQIVPSPDAHFPPPFDYATVTVEASAFRLRFTRGREELIVQVAPRFSANSWHELSTVLSALDPPGVKRGSIVSLFQVGDLLRQYVCEISKALSENEYSQLKVQLAEIYKHDRIITKQLENEINRRLYG
jgi:hypothetical protein